MITELFQLAETFFKGGYIIQPTLITGILAALPIFYYYVKHLEDFRKLFAFFQNHINKKDEALILTDSVTDIEIQERINALKFKRFFGFYLEKARRELLIKFHTEYELQFSWKEIGAARPFIKYRTENIYIEISKADKLFYKASNVIVLFLFILSFLTPIFYFSPNSHLSLKTIGSVLFPCFYFVGFGIWILNINYGLSCGLRIKKAIEEINK